jgi:hypothetical protein
VQNIQTHRLVLSAENQLRLHKKNKVQQKFVTSPPLFSPKINWVTLLNLPFSALRAKQNISIPKNRERKKIFIQLDINEVFSYFRLTCALLLSRSLTVSEMWKNVMVPLFSCL